MKEAHPWQTQDKEGRRRLFSRREEGGRARLIMVLKEVRARRQDLGRQVQEVALHARGISGNELVIETLVVGVIKAKLLQAPFQTPISLRKEEKPRQGLFHCGNGLGPELRGGGRARGGEMLPGAAEHVLEQQHGHVAADAVAPAGDGPEQAGHCGAGGRASVIQLDGIRPGRAVRLLAMRQPARAKPGLLAKGPRARFWSLHEQVRPLCEPAMIQAKMVRHEIQEQLQPVRMEAAAELGQSRFTPQCRRRLVVRDGVRRATHVLRLPAGQNLVVKAPLKRFCQRLAPSAWSAGPDTHQPDMGETQPAPLLELSRWQVGEGHRAAVLFGQPVQPAASVDFIEQRIRTHHGLSAFRWRGHPAREGGGEYVTG